MKILQALHCFGSCVYYLTQLIIILQTSQINDLVALGIHYISGIPLLQAIFPRRVVFCFSECPLDWLIVYCLMSYSGLFHSSIDINFWWRSVGCMPSFWAYNSWAVRIAPTVTRGRGFRGLIWWTAPLTVVALSCTTSKSALYPNQFPHEQHFAHA